MKVIPINNNYYNQKTYNTIPIRNVSFQGLFSKSLQDKFDDGIAALDGTSVFIFGPENEKESIIYQFNQNANKIDIPVLKTYSYFAPKDELPKYRDDNSFAIYKSKDKYYIMSLKQIFGLHVGKHNAEPDDSIVSSGEIKELLPGYEIEINKNYSNEKEDVIFVFNPPKYQNSFSAEKYMEVQSRFSDKTALGKFNRASAEVLSRDKKTSGAKERQYTFEDIGGLEEQKEELRKYVLRPLMYPDVFKHIRLNKGILLYGPPRCGKTLLGKALANEASIKYKYMNANEFKGGVVGSSEGSVRRAFEGILAEPSILFIDEFDAIGKTREGSHNARYDDSLVNQLLGSLSDLEKSYTNSFVIAATNRKDLLDEALLASGRFGLHLEIPMPDEKALGSIYDIHSKHQPIGEDVSKEEIIKTVFENKFNGSDVAEMLTVGYYNALERLGMNAKMDAKTFRFEDLKRIRVNMGDLTKAITKISVQKGIKK